MNFIIAAIFVFLLYLVIYKSVAKKTVGLDKKGKGILGVRKGNGKIHLVGNDDEIYCGVVIEDKESIFVKIVLNDLESDEVCAKCNRIFKEKASDVLEEMREEAKQ